VEDVLAGAATYFALAASYFTKVRVVAVVGDDFTAEHEGVFNKRGVDNARHRARQWKNVSLGGTVMTTI